MRYALIIAGGSGTRLWPMSTQALPKQLIPFINDPEGGPGRSLLRVAMDRLEGLVPNERIVVCAGESTRRAMLDNLPGLSEDRFIGEPMGRDTLNAVGLACSVLKHRDPDATVAVFTADHLIEPVDELRRIVAQGFELAERDKPTLVTFGITPTHAATGYGYLQLAPGSGGDLGPGSLVQEFKEKPEANVAQQYFDAGPEKYLWNSGMFVWKAANVMDCIARYTPENFEALDRLGATWGTPACKAELPDTFGALEKISETVQDWSGGTRIGTTLEEFNRVWSRRVLGQGAVVLMITDGLDRDAGEGLQDQMERLHKSCRRLIWLNPLLRFDGFQPKARGIQAILPHVDDFRPVHNLDSLKDLATALNRPGRRPADTFGEHAA